MAHTRAWDNVDPPNTDKAGLGYQEIQQMKVDIDERMSQMHKWSDSVDIDGEHKYDLVYDNGNSGSSKTIELDNGQTQIITLTAACTLSFSITTQPPTSTGSYKYVRSLTLFVIQDGTGGRIITWPASVKWSFDAAPTVDTTLSTLSIYQFYTINGGTRWYGSYVGSKFTV